MPPDLIKKIGGLVVYLVFFYVDAHDFWPQSHLQAIILGAVGTAGLLFYEIPLKLAGIGSAAVITASIILYVIVGPTPPPPPYRGWLQPAGLATPPNECDRAPDNKELLALLGDNGFFVSRTFIEQHPIMVPISTPCGPVMQISRGPNGIIINSTIFSASGENLGSITGTGYTLFRRKDIIVEQSGDLSTLAVHDASTETELLYIRYLNEHVVKIRGVFACPKVGLVFTIDDQAIKFPRGILSANCLGDNLVGILVH